MTEAVERKINAPFLSALAEQSHAYNQWALTVPNGTVPEDAKHKEFWLNVLSSLRAGDQVRIMPEDGEWMQLVMVRSIKDNEVRVGVMSLIKFEDAAIPGDVIGDYEIKWRGPNARWGVLRRKDSHLLRANFATKGEAHEFVMDQQKFAA